MTSSTPLVLDYLKQGGTAVQTVVGTTGAGSASPTWKRIKLGGGGTIRLGEACN